MEAKNQTITDHQAMSEISKETIESIKKDKSQFMGHLVHNLKNPIGSALSFSDMIIEDLESYSPEKLKRHLKIIKASCEAALHQLDILLIESIIETKELDLYLQETLFSDLIKNCLLENENNFKKNNFELEISFLDNEIKINLDRKFIKYALNSLFQFIILHSENKTHLKLDLSIENNFIIFSIENNQCAKCDENIEDFTTENLNKEKPIFNLKQQKFLNFQDISFIAKKHQGYFSLAKKDSNLLVLTLAISTKLI